MKNESIWKSTKTNNYKKLDKDLNVDILIIGGGITGVSALYNLKDDDVVLVERNKIARGVTANTTGKLNYLQDNTYINMSLQKASLYLKSQLQAIQEAKHIINKNKIECDFTKVKAYLFTKDENNIEKIKYIKKFLEKNDIKVNENDMSILENKYSISVDDTYLFNPIKYINGLLNLVDENKIYEETKIESIEYIDNKYICKTKGNTIICNKIVLATHYPYFIYPYFFPLKCHLEKSYLISYKEKNTPFSLISVDNPVISMRTYQDNIIYLTNNHNLSTNVDDEINFKKLLDKDNIEHIWSNIDIITNDYLPYIGYIKKNFIIATGYNTWGMSNGILSGKIVYDLIHGEENEYINLFDPKRNKRNIRIIGDILSTLNGYYHGFTFKNNNIKYVTVNGESAMIVNNKLYKRKCPHAKCNLIFNEIENTFDCPCHGSRFDINGKCINGPSNYDIDIKNEKEF